MNPRCLCGGEAFATLFRYDAPPKGETPFPFSAGAYARDILRCAACGHCISVHAMDLRGLYEGQYVSASYGADGLRRAFDRITNLPPAASDNVGRVARVLEFARTYYGDGAPRTVLDVGSGLCVFLHRMKAAGWDGTALDPDERAVSHARDVVGVRALGGDFLTVDLPGRFDVVTFNKVLEHVPDPVAMLSRVRDVVLPGGFVYVELPDGEAAAREGPNREEFFIEHLHVFSAASIAILASRAGLTVRSVERLREPSSKFTLRAFVV